MNQPSRISCFSSHGAVLGDSLLSELEQTSSPKSVVWCAGVRRGLPSTSAPHLVEIHFAALARRGQRRFRAGQAAANDADLSRVPLPLVCFLVRVGDIALFRS